MIDIIEYKEVSYPKFQSEGYAAQFAIPYALKVCVGKGYDIGCKKIEWSLPNSIPIDKEFNDGYDALNLPYNEVDYIFSSHCLEHIENWIDVLEYWYKILKSGGVIFLYLPHYSQEYWRPWNNRKHLHSFTIDLIKDCLIDIGFKKIFFSERDLNNSFMIMGEK